MRSGHSKFSVICYVYWTTMKVDSFVKHPSEQKKDDEMVLIEEEGLEWAYATLCTSEQFCSSKFIFP